MSRVEGRVVDQRALAYITEVDAILHAETGVTIQALQTDLKGLPADVGEIGVAYKGGLAPGAFVSKVVAALNLAPVTSFASVEEASAVNVRRAALVTLSREDSSWVRVAGDRNGAVFRDTPEGVERLSVVPSREGKWGWGLAIAEGASIESAPSSEPAPGEVKARLSTNALFRHVISGLDIKSVVPENGYEMAAEASGPSI